MLYQIKNYDRLLGCTGLSEALLKNHFTLYQGYVNNTNKLSELLITIHKEGKTMMPGYAELKRRFGWEWNGMRLHELYFENMIRGGIKIDESSQLHKKIVESFGNYENWKADFKSTGSLRGIGWTILYFDNNSNFLFNTWINEHDAGHLSGCTPLLVMDVFEHAFITDYGLKRASYIDAFFKNIDWNVVSNRFAPLS